MVIFNVPVISQLAGLFTDTLSSWLQIRRIKEEGKIAIERAKVDMQLKQVTSQEDYDVVAAQAMQGSWKDEFLVLVFTFILLGNFIPGVQEYVLVGWEYLSKAPDWFTFSYVGMVAASFGTRWLIQNRFVKGLPISLGGGASTKEKGE